MGLTISKEFVGEPHFPQRAWGVAATDDEAEMLLAVFPEDQEAVAISIAAQLTKGQIDIIIGMNLPVNVMEEKLSFSALGLVLASTETHGSQATALYLEAPMAQPDVIH